MPRPGATEQEKTMCNESIRFVDDAVMEGMTSVTALLNAKKAGVNDREIRAVLFDKQRQEKKAGELQYLRTVCEQQHINFMLYDPDFIAHVASGNTHGGIVALCGRRTYPEPTAETLPQKGFLCLLDGIEDPYNFGYALRSLYAAGCDGILLGERNWMTAAGVVARASAGASELLPMFKGPFKKAVTAARSIGYRVAAAGIRNAVSMYDADLSKPLLLVIGGEKRGISSSVSSLCDLTVRVDYGRSFRGSLSTASAAAVLGFEVLHQNS